MADALPPLTPRSAAEGQQRGSGRTPRRRRQPSSDYASPRSAVRESIGADGALPPPPKSFGVMYGRRTDWAQVTGLPCGDDTVATSPVSSRTEHSQIISPRSSAFSMGCMFPASLSTERVWNQELEGRHNMRVSQHTQHAKKWETKVKPYLQQHKARGRHKTNIERQLVRLRKEESELQKRMAERRFTWDKLGRKLLKDINFLFEKHKERVNETRVGEMQSDGDGVETEVARRHRELRQVEKSIEELKAGEITESKLRTIEGVHKSMLKDLFNSQDEDGGGVLDKEELRQLSFTLGFRLTEKELDAAMAEMDEDGSNEVDFTEFYLWWTNPKKVATLKGTAGSSYFEITPY